jgi:hypothetical protein
MSAAGFTDALASATVVLSEKVSEATELGNIGTQSILFKPIFQGGVAIMLSGVVVVYFISLLIDKFNLYEQLAEELGG